MIRFAAATMFVLALAAPAWSQVESGFAKEGGFAAVSFLPGFTFDGVTFDGQRAYKQVDGEEIAILPRLDTQNLIRLALGYRYRQASIEVSYERTRHNGTFLDFTGKATYQAVNLDGRLFFLTRARVQPYLSLGASLPFFKVTDGSFLGSDVGDATFKGFGANSEAGITVYAHRRFGVSVGYNYRLLWFDQLTGVSKTDFSLRPRFHETSGTIVIGSHFIF
jgi:hypothetical protein